MLKNKLRHTFFKIIKIEAGFYSICIKEFINLILKKTKLRSPKGNQKIKPKVLQIPITNNCNLRCKTCNVYNHSENKLKMSDFRRAMQDCYFSEVTGVGINGGEPFLLSNIEEYIEAVLLLPKIKQISIISNGTLTKKILNNLESIYNQCIRYNVSLNFTTSIDGCEKIHDKVRGVDGAFEKTFNTYKIIKNNRGKYCDRLGVICTLSKHNIYYVKEFIAFTQLHGIDNISYQLAVTHRRLHNEEIEEFTVMKDNHTRMLAQEFFYELFQKTKEKRYYFIFKYLNDPISYQRMSYCKYSNRGLTIDGNGYFAYCATNSKTIGHIGDGKEISDVFYRKENINYRAKLVKEKCKNCIHYTANNGYFIPNILAYKELKKLIGWHLYF